MVDQSQFTIAEWRPAAIGHAQLGADLDMLADLLHATVHAGASIGFMLPFSVKDALAFWRDRVLPAVTSGARAMLIVRRAGHIAGTVQIGLDTMPNQKHRAEIMKLLVHPDARRLGIARALMIAAEAVALAERRTLLTLDTREGDSAQPLYLSMGYVLVGVIPRYARDPHTETLDGTSIMYKALNG